MKLYAASILALLCTLSSASVPSPKSALALITNDSTVSTSKAMVPAHFFHLPPALSKQVATAPTPATNHRSGTAIAAPEPTSMAIAVSLPLASTNSKVKKVSLSVPHSASFVSSSNPSTSGMEDKRRLDIKDTETIISSQTETNTLFSMIDLLATCSLKSLFDWLHGWQQWLLTLTVANAINGPGGLFFLVVYMSSIISPLAISFPFIGPLFNDSPAFFIKCINRALIIGRLLYFRSPSCITDLLCYVVCLNNYWIAIVPIAHAIYAAAYFKTYLMLFIMTLLWYISERLVFLSFGPFKPHNKPKSSLSSHRLPASTLFTFVNHVQHYTEPRLLYHYACSWFAFTCLSFAASFISTLVQLSMSGQERPAHNSSNNVLSLNSLVDNSQSFLDSVWMIGSNATRISLLLFFVGASATIGLLFSLLFSYVYHFVDVADRLLSYAISIYLVPYSGTFLLCFVALALALTFLSKAQMILAAGFLFIGYSIGRSLIFIYCRRSNGKLFYYCKSSAVFEKGFPEDSDRSGAPYPIDVASQRSARIHSTATHTRSTKDENSDLND